MRDSFEFRGKKVLVTGGARGIGLELSRQLVAKGASVVAVGRDAETLAALAEELGQAVATRQADLSQPEAVPALTAWMHDQHSDCSVLINNAAVMHHLDLTEDSLDRLEAIGTEVAINTTAPLQLAVAMLPVLRAHSSAVIVNVTSGLAIAPKRDAAVYCATKAALRSFTRSLRDQCRAAGLSVRVCEAVMTLVDTTLSRPAPVRKYPPAEAARDVIAGVERGLEEIWIEKTKLLRLVHRLSPSLAYRIMRDR
ncbi:SDR family oxidoreductase [Chelativorans sp. YIM 93263]|uniref:SDR family oxidoreductase n=1 Tax=Chelativorans sp. YIM 93263 TaxID=2906648 RepID=UPI002378D6DA|nr:SDR family NAD(P)-dependent oxidoreductase [Chelativorans sp. YIM 93263]